MVGYLKRLTIKYGNQMQKNSIEFGKVPPQSIELEEAVLGALIVESSCINDVLEFIKLESFYKEANATIFKAICTLNESRKSIDLLTIVEELRRTNTLEEVGGVVYISQLSQKVGSAGHVVEHAKTIAEKYIRREFIRLTNELNNDMYDEDKDLLNSINEFDNSKMNILSFTKDEEKHIKEAVTEMVDYSARLNENRIPKGLPTGFKYYDEFSGGIQRGDLFIIAGETSNGKTTLALDILNNSCITGTKAAIFSYEMTTFQLTSRLVSRSQRISSKDIIRGAIDRNNLIKIQSNVSRLSNSELYIVKPSGSSFSKLKRDIARMVKIYGLDMIVIDYIQLLSNPKQNSSGADMIGEIANQLKALAVDLNIAIVLLSQLRREQSNQRPTIARLKGSGDIENAADVVMFTYLPYKYNLVCENVNGESVNIGENAIIIVAKGRNIGTTEFILEFQKEIPGFFNYNSHEQIENVRYFNEVIKETPFD